MKNDIRRTYRKRIMINCAVSALITVIIEFFMIINVTMIQQFNKQSGGSFYLNGQNSYLWLLVYVLVGILVFMVAFYLLQDRTIKYIGEIADAIRHISEGDLTVSVEVKGDDEFSEMANLLNEMAEDIRILITKEREAERTKNELITNVAHDLRTPLTSIIGYLELLNSNTLLTEELRKHYTGIALNKSRKLENLIEDLFGFTKMTYGKISMDVKLLDIVKLLEQLLEEFYPNFAENQMRCQFHSSQPSVLIMADGNLMARLFENLVGNAVKYGRDGKVVLVEVEDQEDIVAISVTNYGYIIPEKELKHIFEKFYRVEHSRASATGGTGLGLAIAKSIVELHGGTIQAESSLKGTVFQVKLKKNFDINKENFERIE